MNAQVEQLNNEGVQYFLNGHLSEAKGKYEEALSLSPKYPTTLNNLGMLLLQEKKYKKAEECFKKAIEVNDSVTYLTNLGHAYANQNELTLAEEQYIKAIDKGENPLLAYKSLASLYQYIGQYQASIGLWEHIVQELSHDADFKLNLAKDYIEIQNFDAAMDVLLEIIQQKKHQELAFYYISLIHFQNQNFGLAMNSIYKSLSILPDNITFRKLAATIHLSLSDIQKAMEQWNFILTLDENNHEVRIDKAIGLLTIQKFEQALEELEFVVRQTDHEKAQFYKALILMELKKEVPKAINTLKKIAKGTTVYAAKAKEYLQQIRK